MWRVATAADDEAVVAMCLALNAEDPGPSVVRPEQVQLTLVKLRERPSRGCAVVCESHGSIAGYALLISFWSNELGGEVCVIDELFVAPQYRGLGLATALFTRLTGGAPALWPTQPAALALEVSPHNQRAMALYQRLGFSGANLALRRLLN